MIQSLRVRADNAACLYSQRNIIRLSINGSLSSKEVSGCELFLAAIATLGFGYALAHELTTGKVVILGIKLFRLCIRCLGITYMYTPELYPTGIRVQALVGQRHGRESDLNVDPPNNSGIQLEFSRELTVCFP